MRGREKVYEATGELDRWAAVTGETEELWWLTERWAGGRVTKLKKGLPIGEGLRSERRLEDGVGSLTGGGCFERCVLMRK